MGRLFFSGKRARLSVMTGAGLALFGLALAPAAPASAASAVTKVLIVSGQVKTGGDAAIKLNVKCTKGANDYIYAEADQDLITNDAAGNVYVSSFSCTGTIQTVWITVAHGRGISHMDYNNDIESDDVGPFVAGWASVLVSMGQQGGPQSDFSQQQRTVNLGHHGVTNVAIKSGAVTTGGDAAIRAVLTCAKGANTYIYAEADQDLPTNDATGNVYVSSFSCTGSPQSVTITVGHGRGISHMDYNNDIESDDLGTFGEGPTSVLVSVGQQSGPQSDFTTQQRTIDLEG
ncbi:MAG: hypothetical protein M3019_11370 [Candidatus Dormibacteraeota bacterium]|nr:hypothetical protein [Candidatus Dormibacteraeota bacterium]